MKKILLLLFLTVFSSNVIAQDNFAKKASKITNETEVLSLSGEEKAKVYQIQLKRFQDVESIREKHKDDA